MTKKQLTRHPLIITVTTLALVTVVAGCGSGSSPQGQLAEDRKVLTTCNKAAPPAADVQIDGTGSSAAKEITEARMAAVEQAARTAAICSGRLRVSVFSSSSTATVTLFDGELPLHGATDNARLKRVPHAVEQVMATVRQGYDPATKRLDRGGSDVTAQYWRTREWIAQLGGTYQLRLLLLTDGFHNVGGDLGKGLSPGKATALARKVPMPKLPGAVVTVAGLGRLAGSPPRSDVVEGLVVYYDALCHKTGAAKCLSVTDYAAGGQ
jgi:hypothetical protein